MLSGFLVLLNHEYPHNKFIGRALANSVSEFIGCLGCRMSQQPRQTRHSWQAYFNGSSWQSWQMAEVLLAFSADGRGFVGILGRWSLAILADGQGFVGILGRWSRVSQQMAKNLSEYSWQIV